MHEKIAPSFLTAPPSLVDPNFQKAVIAVAIHEGDGAMGFIISRQTHFGLHELLGDLDITPKVRDQPVLFGGPVSKNAGFILYEHAPRQPLTDGLVLCDTISISPSRDLLEMAAKGQLPGRFELILGYSGWGPGQIEEEIRSGGWLHTPLFNEVVFDVPVPERWEYTFAQVGVSPLGFIRVPGGAHA